VSKRTSLSARLILLFVAAELLLIGVFATGSFLFSRRRLHKSFDTALRAHADAFSTLVREGKDGTLTVTLTEDSTSRFVRKRHRDVFAVFAADGARVDSELDVEPAPEWATYVEKRQFRAFTIDGERYRGILYPSHATLEGEAPGNKAKGSRITIFYAGTTHDLDDDIEDIQEFMLIAGGTIILLSTLAAFGITKRVLKPLHDMTNVAGKIDAVSLNRRFVVKRLPSDLQPLGKSFNELLARLEGSFDRERRFSAEAAHELRTPVAVLKSGIQAALITPPDQVRDREALQELLEDVERIATLCESLLIVGKPSSSRARDVQISAQDIVEVVMRVVDSLSPSAERVGGSIRVHTELDGDGVVLRTDEDSASRILTNLVENAIRYGGDGVEVSITLRASDEFEAELIVEDNGPGIPPELEQRLFERFARGDESRTRATGGTGLGLAISRALALADGGRLVHEKANGGDGARFVWRIVLLA